MLAKQKSAAIMLRYYGWLSERYSWGLQSSC